MKPKNMNQLAFLCLLFLSSLGQAQQNKINPEVLVGHWKLDMTPQDVTDNNFAQMKIFTVSKNTFNGTFYNPDTSIENAVINTQIGLLYGALVSGDNSGSYNTSFYYKEGKLYGSTHSLGRNFLALWTATKIED